MKLIMTKGLPASGKTTWAKAQNAFRVNKDDLRSMMNNGKWSKTNEKYVLLIRDSIIKLHLADKNTVVVDDTNLAPKHEERLKQLAREFKADFEIKDFTDVSLDECIKRDQKRSNYVGEKVIRQMYNQFLKPQPKIVKDDENLPTAVICDIDGTLALFGDANPYERDFTQDKVNMRIYELLHRVVEDRTILLVSGRQEKFKDQTVKWLKTNSIPYEYLFMRKTGDVRKDVIVKREIYQAEIEKRYNVLFVLDDRNQVVEMWRQEGLICLQVAEGDF